MLVRLRALAVASGTLLSVCDGGRPEFRLVRGLLQKDDDEDDEDADDGLFRHLAGRTQRRDLGRFELLARRPSPSPGLALHQRAASEMRFHIQIMRRLEPRKQLAQPARRLQSKVAHWRSPSFSITTTKRIGLQCQISTKTRSLLYPDIKPEPGGEQLRGASQSNGCAAEDARLPARSTNPPPAPGEHVAQTSTGKLLETKIRSTTRFQRHQAAQGAQPHPGAQNPPESSQKNPLPLPSRQRILRRFTKSQRKCESS